MNNATKGKAMKLLTPGFTVTDKQSAPSGYYRLSFRSSTGDYVVATQHARGGCNIYASTTENTKAEFDSWLESNVDLAVSWFKQLGWPDLAEVAATRGIEWQDIVVMAILDHIELGMISVEG